jgi:hypothetical protein
VNRSIFVMSLLIGTLAVLLLRQPAPGDLPLPRLVRLKPVPAATTRTSLKELIAVRRLAAHDEAVRRNAEAKQQCSVFNEKRRETFASLYGSVPATPGTAFGGLRVDRDWFRPIEGAFPIHWEPPNLVYATVADGAKPFCGENDDPAVFCPFRCTRDVDADCDALSSSLERAWGDSVHAVWRDRANRVRAVVRAQPHMFTSGPADCELRFQRYVPAGEWIAMNNVASVPLGLVGQAKSKLPESASAEYSPDADRLYRWEIAVTGDHIMRAWIDAHIRGSRIVRIDVTGELDPDGGADEIHELVRPYRDRGLYVSLETTATSFTLAIARTRLEPTSHE